MNKTKLLDFSGYTMADLSQEALYNYFVYGFAPGSFINAVLCNDLYRAVSCADHWNKDLIGDYAKWVMHNAPHGSFGSQEIVQSWLSKNLYYEDFQKQLTLEVLKTPA